MTQEEKMAEYSHVFSMRRPVIAAEKGQMKKFVKLTYRSSILYICVISPFQ